MVLGREIAGPVTEAIGEEVTVTIPELTLLLCLSLEPEASPLSPSLFCLRPAEWAQHSWKYVSPDVTVVGGIKQMSTDVLEHVLGSATAPGIEDLCTAHQNHTMEDSGQRLGAD